MNITWTIDDVKSYVKENEIQVIPELTDDDCNDVLEELNDYAIYDEYGPQRGVSIDKIGDFVRRLFADRIIE
ncbi:hypothetical protein [Selenomonas ruminantium]|uniref:hypothetical protein n=1 Tax=Selenomonas ruminantium TaxID=971 RepID=UPI0026F2E033|nr:hypothetical protein [Selenomonas ruminantium]